MIRQASKMVVFGSNGIVLTTSFSTILILSEIDAMAMKRRCGYLLERRNMRIAILDSLDSCRIANALPMAMV